MPGLLNVKFMQLYIYIYNYGLPDLEVAGTMIFRNVRITKPPQRHMAENPQLLPLAENQTLHSADTHTKRPRG